MHRSSSVHSQARTLRCQPFMWSLPHVICLCSLYLSRDGLCCALRVGDNPLGPSGLQPHNYASGINSRRIEMVEAFDFAHPLPRDGRVLHQIPSRADTIVSLNQVCPSIDSTTATFLCKDSDIRLASGQVYEVRFQMPASNSTSHALEVVLLPSEGDVDLDVFRLTDDKEPTELQAKIGYSANYGLTREHSHIESKKAPPGSSIAIQIVPEEDAMFSMMIEVLEEGDGTLAAQDFQVLTRLSTNCCAHGGCEATLQSFADGDAPVDACREIQSWYCNAAGHIIDMSLGNQGMECSLESLDNLFQLTELQRFELSDAPGVTGDINTLLSALGQDYQLRVMIIRNTSISGDLPAACPAGSVLNSLAQLHIEDSPVAGFIPDCLLSLSTLTLIHTAIGGPMPALSSTSPLSRLELIQKDDDGERISGDAATFANLQLLTRLRLEYTAFTGALSTGPRVAEVVTVGPQHSSFQMGTAPGELFALSQLLMTDGRMSGAVPLEVLTAPALTHLSLRGNLFTSMPQDWGSPSLKMLDLSDNAIEGPVPVALGKQAALETADLSNNLLSGPLNAFASEIIENSRLYRLNLANNRLTGPMSGLGNLGVFREGLSGTSPVRAGSPTSTHALNMSANNFQGELPLEMYGAASAGGPSKLPRIDIDIRSNPLMICPDPDLINNAVEVWCDSEAAADANASSLVPTQSTTPPPTEKLSAASIVAVCVSLLVVFVSMAAALYYCQRRRAGAGDGTYMHYKETPASAVPQSDTTIPESFNLEQV